MKLFFFLILDYIDLNIFTTLILSIIKYICRKFKKKTCQEITLILKKQYYYKKI